MMIWLEENAVLAVWLCGLTLVLLLFLIFVWMMHWRAVVLYQQLLLEGLTDGLQELLRVSRTPNQN